MPQPVRLMVQNLLMNWRRMSVCDAGGGNMHTAYKVIAGLVLGAMMLAAVGCASQPLTTREEGTLGGGALGAGSGAIIGAVVGHPAAGALIGGGLGALGGFAVGNEMQNQENQQAQTQQQISQQQQQIEEQRREMEEMKQQQQTE
jgi:osmotically inducible lipoprotein OsmB